MKWSDPATIARISFLKMVCNMGRIGHIYISPMISIWHDGRRSAASVLRRQSQGRPGPRERPTGSAISRRIRQTEYRCSVGIGSLSARHRACVKSYTSVEVRKGVVEEGSLDLDLKPTPSLVAGGVCTAKQVGKRSSAVRGDGRVVKTPRGGASAGS